MQARTSAAPLYEYLPRAASTIPGQEDYTVPAWATVLLYASLYPVGLVANWWYLRKCNQAHTRTGMWPRGYRVFSMLPWFFVVLPILAILAGVIIYSVNNQPH